MSVVAKKVFLSLSHAGSKACLLLLALVLQWVPSASSGAEAVITLKRDGQQWRFSATQLLQRKDAIDINVPADVAYRHPMQFRALPLANLLREQGFTEQGTLNFQALDGFTAPIDAALVLAQTGPQAWLAVEPSDSPWPKLSPDGASAGPFYLVWQQQPTGGVPQEQWPFQIESIELTVAPEQRFPMILPDLSLPRHHPAWTGFAVYKENCIACHKINGGGDGVLGPDLNLPHNPTEYFAEPFLKKLIRNPAQVQQWAGSKMPAFNTETISDEELTALIAYLKAMKDKRPQADK
ncbi:MAG TPA: cytochrome c [Dongiaceae bacterium]|nr:cytochrome c [Dongiaceae bacterium]